MVNVWTDEAVATLREMWADHPGSAIGKRIGKSRNAVIGMARRLALPAKPREFGFGAHRRKENALPPVVKPSPKKAKAKKHKRRVWNNIRRPENVRPPMHIVAPPAPIEPLNLTLMQLGSNQCHFIAGEPGSGYCGHPVEARSLCAFHYRLCWRRLDPELSRRHRRSAEYMARVGA